METFTLHAAKTNLSKLVKRVEGGEEIILARGDKPVARLVPLAPETSQGETGPRGLGLLSGMKPVPDGFFFDPLPDDDLDLWNGSA